MILFVFASYADVRSCASTPLDTFEDNLYLQLKARPPRNLYASLGDVDLDGTLLTKSRSISPSAGNFPKVALSAWFRQAHDGYQINYPRSRTAQTAGLVLKPWEVQEEGETLCVSVPQDISRMPLPHALMAALPSRFPTATAAEKASDFDILINGAAGCRNMTVSGGDELQMVPEHYWRLDAIYEDAHVLVVRKPPGMVTTRNNRRPHLQRTLSSSLFTTVPGTVPAHRLDVVTEGLVVCARTRESRSNLTQQFANRDVVKVYRAVVHGNLDDEGIIDAPIDGKAAKTRWRVRWRGRSPCYGRLTSLDLWLETGRRHQLRRHLAEVLGTPIVGDDRYNQGQHTLKPPLLLASLEVAFNHPVSGERIELVLDEPMRFQQAKLFNAKCNCDTSREAEDEQILLAAAVRLGQRQNESWRHRWTNHLQSEAGRPGDPRRHGLTSLRAFMYSVKDDFQGAPWLTPLFEQRDKRFAVPLHGTTCWCFVVLGPCDLESDVDCD